MEILAVFAGLWLVLVGLYIAVMLRSRRGAPGQATAHAGVRSAAFSARMGVSEEQPVLGGLFSEVDMLRLQLETLRSEVSALNGEPRAERARLRRYRPGQYTQLPRTLRRQVREVRSFRRPVHI